MVEISTAKEKKLREIIADFRAFRSCNPDDDPAEINAVTTSYRFLVIQFKRLAIPILPYVKTLRLDELVVEPMDVYSVYDAMAEIETIILDVEEVLDSITASKKVIPTNSLDLLLQEKDIPSVSEEFIRCLENIESDPPTAITAACAMLEAACKVYIEDKNLEMPNKQTIRPLWKETSKHLGLNPATPEDEDVKQILSGFVSAVHGIGDLRTHAGNAHGRGKTQYRVEPRHARLAVHASCTLVVLLMETWDQCDD